STQRGVNSPSRFFRCNVLSGGNSLEHRQNARMIQVTGRDAFEVRTDTAQFGSHKTVHEVQAAIQPGKELILDVIVNGECDFGAIWPNLSEINDPHQRDISAHRLGAVLARRLAPD